MATKKKGQKPETPIPAAIWFENQTLLPTQIAKGMNSPRPTKAPLSSVNKRTEAVPAAIWFENNDMLPGQSENENKIVKKEKPQAEPTGKPAVSLSTATPTVNLSKDAHIDELIDSILNLTKTIKEDHIQKIKDEQIGESDEVKYKSFKDLIKSIVTDKTAQVKNAFSARNLLLSAGMNSAFRGSDTIVDRLLSYAESKKTDNTPKEKKPSIAGSIALGTFDYARKKTSKALSPITDSKYAQKLGSMVDVTKSVVKIPKINIESPIKKLDRASRIEAIQNPDSLWGSISRRYYPEISKNPELETSRILTNPSSKEERAFTNDVKSGMKDELTALNEKQLEQLKKIVGALTTQNDKETRLEAQDKAPEQIAQKKIEVAEKEDADNKSLLKTVLGGFDKLKDIVAGSVGSIGRVIASAMGPLMKIAGPALAVAGAGAAGYAAGTWANNNIITPSVTKILGRDATLGTAIYDAVDSVSGWFGNSDADKLSKAEGKSRHASGKIVDMQASKYRVNQTNNIKSKLSEIEKQKSNNKPSTQIVDNRTNVTNTSNTVQYIRPPIKSNDSTFNQLLNRNFSH